MLAFKYLEVFVEERSISLELLLRSDLTLAVIGRVYEMVENMLLSNIWLRFIAVTDDFFDLLRGSEAGPHDQLELAEH